MVDANIVFSALIKASHTRYLIVEKGWKLYAPEFLLEEVNKYMEELCLKSGLSTDAVNEVLYAISSHITIVPANEFKSFLPLATKISPDVKDTQYFALALKLGCAVWSNDAKLKNQKTIKVFSTQELTRTD